MSTNNVHKSGKFKQKNKPHKNKHSSKRALKNYTKGKVNGSSAPLSLKKIIKNTHDVNCVNAKAARKNHSKQSRHLQKQKIQTILEKIGDLNGKPRIILCIVTTVNEFVDVPTVLFHEISEYFENYDINISTNKCEEYLLSAKIEINLKRDNRKFPTNILINVLYPDRRKILETCQLMRQAHQIAFITCPDAFDNDNEKNENKNGVRFGDVDWLFDYLVSEPLEKLFHLSLFDRNSRIVDDCHRAICVLLKNNDFDNLKKMSIVEMLRMELSLKIAKKIAVPLKDITKSLLLRPSLLIEEVEVLNENGTVKITGTLLDNDLSNFNKSVHIFGLGDFPIAELTVLSETNSSTRHILENNLDLDLANLCINVADHNLNLNNLNKNNNNGTADFNRNESDSDFLDSSSSNEEQLSSLSNLSDEFDNDHSGDSNSYSTISESIPDYKNKELFSAYRGIESLKTSEWNQNLDCFPPFYSDIYKIKNINHVKAHIVKKKSVIAKAGSRINIVVHNLPTTTKNNNFVVYNGIEKYSANKIISFLYPYEDKFSIAHYLIKLNKNFSSQAYQNYVVIIGGGQSNEAQHRSLRGFKTNSLLLSEYGGHHYRNHKLLNFEENPHTDNYVLLSVAAPIHLTNEKVHLFGEDQDNYTLLATGQTLNPADPDKVVVAERVLTGNMTKIFGRHAVVSNMFDSRDDVFYFKPVALRTKKGYAAKIIEPLGTHGKFKCRISKSITTQQVLFLKLYKRVYPEFNLSLFF